MAFEVANTLEHMRIETVNWFIAKLSVAWDFKCPIIRRNRFTVITLGEFHNLKVTPVVETTTKIASTAKEMCLQMGEKPPKTNKKQSNKQTNKRTNERTNKQPPPPPPPPKKKKKKKTQKNPQKQPTKQTTTTNNN